MGRIPCCAKDGVKKGPWTPEEDVNLVSYIQEHGSGNWTSVPANAGKIFFFFLHRLVSSIVFGFFYWFHKCLITLSSSIIPPTGKRL